jgi:hypothetical protein
MKSFFQFLSEASESQAAMQAKKLGYTGDGHGGWVDRTGKVVARTENGKLKLIGKKSPKGSEEPADEKKPAAAPQAQDTSKVQAQPTPQPSGASQQEPEGQPDEEGSTLTIVFGRFNPPTIGHEKLLKAADKESTGGDLKIYPSRTQDAKKNPLDPDTKISVMRKIFPKFGERIINDSKMKSIFDVLQNASEEGYLNVNIVVGSDRQAEFDNLAQKYNGDLYNFELINVISAGMRDADAEGTEGMSASKMRKAVMDGDFESFRKGTPKSLDDGEAKNLFNAVRQGMGVKGSKVKKESYCLWEIAPKFDMRNLRENYVKEKIYKLGDIVENLNTGLVGKITRRSTNHLICVTEQNYMFKSWIKDVMEYTETKMSRKQRLPGKPNTLVGTSGYFKYVADMTPGFEKGDKTNLQSGAKPYKGYINIKEFINKYRKIKESTYSNVS